LVKHTEIMNRREEEILKIVEYLSEQTSGFEKPKIILIGGYALRAFTSFSRYTRDCDFVLKKSDEWSIERIQKMLSKEMSSEACEKHGTHAFLRCVKLLKPSAKISRFYGRRSQRKNARTSILYH